LLINHDFGGGLGNLNARVPFFVLAFSDFALLPPATATLCEENSVLAIH
jgi:hypothetical protein